MKNISYKIKKALEYIEEHLDQEFIIDDIANYIGLSKFHFSRVFKEEIGEPISFYIRRLRLERASVLMYSKNQSILFVANQVGYSTPCGFSRSFNSYFKQNPEIYKRSRNRNLEYYSDKKILPKIIETQSTNVVYKRYFGSYMDSASKSWSLLKAKLLDKAPHILQRDYDLMGICYDDPSITKFENLRYDSYIPISKEETEQLKNLDFDIKTINAYKLAFIIHYGDYINIYDRWMQLYLWALDEGYECIDTRLIIQYIKTPDEVSIEDLETKIYIILEEK